MYFDPLLMVDRTQHLLTFAQLQPGVPGIEAHH